MNQKPGRNDPCPCGSGKKFKSCCFLKNPTGKRKITAKWLSAPTKSINLMDRTFGAAITSSDDKPPVPPTPSASDTSEQS